MFSPVSLRVSGTLWEEIAFAFNQRRKFIYLTLLTNMKTTEKLSAIQFHVECTMEAKLRFATLHESLGFKTKSQTFEAILYFVSTKDKIDPAVLSRIEVKLDHMLEALDSLL